MIDIQRTKETFYFKKNNILSIFNLKINKSLKHVVDFCAKVRFVKDRIK